MHPPALPYVLPLFAAAVLCSVLVVYAFRHTSVAGAVSLAFLSLAVAEWTLGYGLEIAAVNEASKVLWAKLQYLGIVTAPVAWLVFAGRFAGRATWLGGRHLLALLAIPALTLALVLTNEWHHVVWRSIELVAVSPLARLEIEYGPWFWVHAGYSYLAMALGSVLLVMRALYASRLHMRQIVLLLVSAITPWAANVMYLARIPPFGGIDPTPFAFALSSLLLGWGLLRNRLLDILPIARDVIVLGMRDGVIVVDSRGRVVDINPAAENFFGRSAAAVVGQPAAEVFGDHPALAALASNFAEQRATIVDEREPRRLYDVSVAPFADHRGRPGGWLVTMRDVTKQARDEATRRFLLAQQETMQRVARAISTSLRLDEIFEVVVAQICEAFGYQMVSIYLREGDQLNPQAWTGYDEVMSPIRVDRGVSGRVVRTGRAAFVQDADADPDFIFAKPGTRQAIITPLKTHEGEVIGTLAVESTGEPQLTDDDFALLSLLADQISVAVVNARLFEELRASREAAEAGARAKGAFLAQMSHEIRNPMNGVVGVTELLLRTDLSPEQRALVEVARASSRTLLEQLNDTLDYLKIEVGRLELAREPFDLRGTIEDALEQVALPAAEKRLDLSYRIEPGVPLLIVGDRVRLQQILVNLFSNAVKFTDRGEVAAVVSASALADERCELRFEVRDTGIGIPLDRVGELFQPFSQIDSSSARRRVGSGLGLAISRQLCQLMGGTMWVESDGRSGSTFFFTLRVEAPRKWQDLDDEPGVLAGRQALLVAQESSARRALAAQLAALGVGVQVCGSPEEALQVVARGWRFDVAILGLPPEPCVDLARALRAADAAGMAIVRLAWLGETFPPAEAELFQGALYRPVKQPHLRALLARLIHRQPLASPLAAVRQPLMQPLRVLIVDDDRVSRQLFAHLLDALGHEAEIVSNGAAALEALARQRYDLLFLDVRMPDVDGVEVVRTVRSTLPPPQQPYIVAVTGDSLARDRERYLDAGMNDVLSKPVWLHDLRAALERFSAASGQRAHEVGGTASARGAAGNGKPGNGAGEPDQGAGDSGETPSRPWLTSLIASYIEDGAALLDSMRAAAARGDLRTLAQCAHRLKSSSALVGAAEVARLCEELEDGVGGVEDAVVRVLRIENVFTQARTRLGLLNERERR